MCPVCISGIVVMASGVMSSGGLTTLAWKKFGAPTDALSNAQPNAQATSLEVKVEGGKHESTNAGK
jgi:hypothetical protein